MLIYVDAIFSRKIKDFCPIGPAKGAWSAAVSHRWAGERGLRIMAAAGEEKGKRTMGTPERSTNDDKICRHHTTIARFYSMVVKKDGIKFVSVLLRGDRTLTRPCSEIEQKDARKSLQKKTERQVITGALLGLDGMIQEGQPVQ
ncbi:hypothetical protein [Desulfobulbus propionicus]